MISNKEISKAFKLAASLLELHDDNPFKARSMQNAAFKIDRLPSALASMSEEEIAQLDGVGKSIQGKIREYLNKESFDELDHLLELTPAFNKRHRTEKGKGALEGTWRGNPRGITLCM
jgi:DNA polymerase (family 10)